MKISTKKALIASALSLVLCVSMLVGSTFAWFTDTATTSVNKIVAGNLDIELQMATEWNDDGSVKTWANAEGKTLPFLVKGEIPAEGTKIYWEPGCTYYVPEVRVLNKGNLAVKFEYLPEMLGSTDQLFEVLELVFNVPTDAEGNEVNIEPEVLQPGEASPAWSFGYHMKETAGNEYQGLTATGMSLTVVASQATYEKDSKDDQYDKDAEYPTVVTDATSIADAVADLATAGNKVVVVTVAKDVDNTSGIRTAKGNTFTMDMNGKSVGVSYGAGSANTTTNGMQLLQGSTVTLKNGTYKANHGEDASHNIAILIQNYSDLTIESCTLDMREANDTAGNSKGTSYVLSTNCGKVVIKGNTNIYARNGEYALDVMHWENTSYKEEGTSVVFDETMTGTVDGKIDVYCYRNNKVVKPVDDGGALLVIKGGTFKNSGLTLDQFKAFVPTGYTVTTNADGSYTVSK